MTSMTRRRALELAVAATASTAFPVFAASEAPLKIGWIYNGPVGDGGWVSAHDKGRRAVEERFGDRVQTLYVENVPESSDTERVARDLVGQGCSLIFGTTFGFMNYLLKVAQDSPGVRFEHCAGYKTAPNMRIYEARNYEGAYLAGMVGGAMTKTNQLGFVATVPIPEVLRNLNSFALGVSRTNPDARIRVLWLNEWDNPPKEVEATTSLVNNGADILFQNTSSSAVFKTAASLGKHAFGFTAAMGHLAPEGNLGSAIIDWGPYYINSVQQLFDGSWTSEGQWWGLQKDTVDLVEIPETVPDDIRTQVEQARAGLQDGSFSIWTGPIKDNGGQELLASGERADDDFLRAINFYLPNVLGRVPA